MSVATLFDRLQVAGIRLAVNGEKLRVDAPEGVLTPELRAELAEHKPELIEALRRPSPLVEAARGIAPVIRLTVRETEDVIGDVAFLRRIRAVLEEWAGSNRVLMRLPTLDGRRPVVRCYALACPELRLVLARLLAERGMEVAP